MQKFNIQHTTYTIRKKYILLIDVHTVKQVLVRYMHVIMTLRNEDH